MAVGHGAKERDWYRVLGVGRHDGGDRIREAYRDLAWRLHPDRHATADPVGGASDAERRVSERRMREVNEAFRVLGEPARRRAYDHERFGSGTSGTGRTGRTGQAERPRRTAVEAPVESDDDWIPVAGDGVHGILFSRLVPLMMAALLVGIVVFSAFAGGNVDGSSADDPGCVLGNTLVGCDQPNDGRIVGLADSDHRCPDGGRLVKLASEYCVES